MSTISVSLKKPGYDPFLGFVPIQGIGLSPRKLFNRCCAAGGRGGKVRREVGRRLLIVLGLKEDEHYLGFSQETRI
jgi:hypothetical protein